MDKKTNIYNDEDIARYFCGELEEKYIEKMEEELLNNKKNEKEMKDFARIWKKSADVSVYDKLDVDSDWEKVRDRMGFRTRRKKLSFKKYLLRVAAIVVLAVGLSYFLSTLIKSFPTDPENDYFQITSTGIKEVILPDHSVITLNKNATLFYNNNYGKANRDVILEGEAFFKVVKNASLPFKVFVDNSTIEVLGTQFNIKPQKGNVQVSVLSGKVAFYATTSKSNRVELVKNEQAQYNVAEQSFEEKTVLDSNNIAWKTKLLKFEDNALEEVFQSLEDYFGVQIKITDASILNAGFNGEIPIATALQGCYGGDCRFRH